MLRIECRRWIFSPAIFLLPVLISGCTSDAATSGCGAAEGTPNCYAAPPEFPLAFTIDLPESVEVEAEPADAGATLRFVHESSSDAFLYIFVHPDSVGRSEAEEIVQSIADSYGVIRQYDEPEPLALPWATVAYEIAGAKAGQEELKGFVALGNREGRWYHVLLQYPAAGEAEYRPALEGILDGLNWAEESR